MQTTKHKKWLIAFYVSFGEEKILKTWTGKVSYDVTDVTVPLNTIFYFFSEQEEVNLSITILKLSKVSLLTAFEGEPVVAQDNKLYCCGKRVNDSLVLVEDGKISSIQNFLTFSMSLQLNLFNFLAFLNN